MGSHWRILNSRYYPAFLQKITQSAVWRRDQRGQKQNQGGPSRDKINDTFNINFGGKGDITSLWVACKGDWGRFSNILSLKCLWDVLVELSSKQMWSSLDQKYKWWHQRHWGDDSLGNIIQRKGTSSELIQRAGERQKNPRKCSDHRFKIMSKKKRPNGWHLAARSRKISTKIVHPFGQLGKSRGFFLFFGFFVCFKLKFIGVIIVSKIM